MDTLREGTQKVRTLKDRALTLILFPLLVLVLSVAAAAQTEVDYPNAVATVVTGINDTGTMVGYFYTSDGSEHSFLYDGANFRSFDYQGAIWTEATGINQGGDVVGYYGIAADNVMHGFLRTADGAFKSLDIPGRFNFMPEGINSNSNQTIVGCMHNPGTMHGWTMQNGAVVSVSPAYRMYDAINDDGTIVGWVFSAPSKFVGFILSGAGETQFSYPGSNVTEPWGINNDGDVVGRYGPNSSIHGFLWKDGTFTSIDVPGATATIARGINNNGAIVGTFIDANGGMHGFVLQP